MRLFFFGFIQIFWTGGGALLSDNHYYAMGGWANGTHLHHSFHRCLHMW